MGGNRSKPEPRRVEPLPGTQDQYPRIRGRLDQLLNDPARPYFLTDLEAGRWVKIRDAPRNGQGRMVAASRVFLIAGATNESSANGLVAYHP